MSDTNETAQVPAKSRWDHVKHIWTLVIAVLGLAVALFTVVQIIDWRVRSVVDDEEFVKRIASHVRPYVIFDHNGSIIADGGAMEYLVPIENSPIEVNVTEERSGVVVTLQVDVKPKQHLATAPLLEVLSTHRGIMTSKRGEGHRWIYDFNVTAWIGNDDSKDDVGRVVRFRLEILN